MIDASNATKCVRDELALKNVSIQNEIIKINPFTVTCEVFIYFLSSF